MHGSMDTGLFGASTSCLRNYSTAERSLTDDYAEVVHGCVTPTKLEGMVQHYWLCINMPARVGETFACVQQCTVVMVTGDIVSMLLEDPCRAYRLSRQDFDHSVHGLKGSMLLANFVREADGMTYISSGALSATLQDVRTTRHYRISGRANDTFALTWYALTYRGTGLKWNPAFSSGLLSHRLAGMSLMFSRLGAERDRQDEPFLNRLALSNP